MTDLRTEELYDKCKKFDLSDEKTLKLINHNLVRRYEHLANLMEVHNYYDDDMDEINEELEDYRELGEDLEFAHKKFKFDGIAPALKSYLECRDVIRQILEIYENDFHQKATNDEGYILEQRSCVLDYAEYVFKIATQYLFHEIDDLDARIKEAVESIKLTFTSAPFALDLNFENFLKDVKDFIE